MTSTLTIPFAAVLLTAMPLTGTVEAHGRQGQNRDRAVSYYRHSDGRYWSDRDIRLMRNYYRLSVRRLPSGLVRRYHRTGQLPPGWAKRVQRIPPHVERRLEALPRGYRRGIVDGRAIVYAPGGVVIDVAVLF